MYRAFHTLTNIHWRVQNWHNITYSNVEYHPVRDSFLRELNDQTIPNKAKNKGQSNEQGKISPGWDEHLNVQRVQHSYDVRFIDWQSHRVGDYGFVGLQIAYHF